MDRGPTRSKEHNDVAEAAAIHLSDSSSEIVCEDMNNAAQSCSLFMEMWQIE